MSPEPPPNLMPAGKSDIPKATHWGELEIGGRNISAYVLDNGERVFSIKGLVVGLIGTEGGQLAEYLKVKALQPHLPQDLMPAEAGEIPALFKFDTGGQGISQVALGMKVERFNDLLRAYADAMTDHARTKAEDG